MKTQNLFERIYNDGDDKIFGLTYLTKNYDLFCYIDGNRDINQYNVLKLAGDIERKGQIEDILVDENFFVIDGQHRIAACKQIKEWIKFRFVNTNGLNTLLYVESANTVRKNWGWREYLRMYCKLGDQNYINYKKLIDQFEFDHTAMLAIIYLRHSGGGKSGPDDFNKGNLKVRASEVQTIVDRLSNVEYYWKLISRAYANIPGKNRKRPPAKLVKALARIMKHENYNHEMMVGKLKNDVSGFVGVNTIEGFVGELTKVYNLRNKTNIIKFD